MEGILIKKDQLLLDSEANNGSRIIRLNEAQKNNILLYHLII